MEHRDAEKAEGKKEKKHSNAGEIPTRSEVSTIREDNVAEWRDLCRSNRVGALYLVMGDNMYCFEAGIL